jgi:hypothetical protein
MSNRLIKETHVSYLPGSPYVPADPGQAWQPAHWVTQTRYICLWEPSAPIIPPVVTLYWWPGPAPGQSSYPDNNPNPHWTAIPGAVYPAPQPSYVYVCRDRQETVWQPTLPFRAPSPARPAVPAQVIIDYDFGWDASARSITELPGDGFVAFDGPATAVGVLAGIISPLVTTGYMRLPYALSFSHGAVRVVEHGVVLASLGTTVAADRWVIRRLSGVVTYEKNGSVMHTSAVPSSGPIVLVAMLFSGGDFVDSPVVVGINSGAVSFEPLALLGSDHPYGAGRLTFEPLTVTGRSAVGGGVAFEPLTVLGSDRPYGEARIGFLPLAVSGEGGLPVPSYGLGAVSLAYPTVSGHGFSGGIGGSAVSFLPLTVRGSDHNYGEARLSFEPLLVGGSGFEGNTKGTLYSRLTLGASASTHTEVFVVWNESLTLATILTVQIDANVDMRSLLDLSDYIDAIYDVPALMRSTMVLSGLVPVFSELGDISAPGALPSDGSDTWVINADTQAAGRYENHGFNSYGVFAGRAIGAKASGLYYLDGEADGSTPIHASVNFGKHTFGVSALKRMSNAYIGCASSGRMYLKITADGTEHIYASRLEGTGLLKQNRFDIGKGIRANYLEFELFNSDGANFELESVEFIAVPLARRI